MTFNIARMIALSCAAGCLGQSATPGDPGADGLAAVATNADVSYCFARERGLDPGHQPASYINLQLRVRVAYRNAGTRPLILPLERERTIYYGLKPDGMSPFQEDLGLFEPAVKAMKELPAEVSLEGSELVRKNDVFTVIPAGGGG